MIILYYVFINIYKLSNLPNQSNNILSYFIKDIKDAKELAFYKQKNHNTIINILYKDKLIYKIDNYCYNYITNIIKSLSIKFINKSNICYNYWYNCKYLYYKKDTIIKYPNPNSIKFYFNCNKYLNKTLFYIIRNNKTLLSVIFNYYKKYKYIRNYNFYTKISTKFTSPQILIPNKYELDYYCKFFNLYLFEHN